MPAKTISLALQGGGSHGAFTWGVLDRLLEEGLAIEAISGASAGALNAAVLACGFSRGGPDGARAALSDFWQAVASTLPPPSFDIGFGDQPNPAIQSLLMISRFLAPSEFNPLGLNPLRDILAKQIDCESLRADSSIRLFIATTVVNTGTLRLFRNRQITHDVLLASSCLPTLHHLITIDGEPHWDGGLTANPPIFPLVHMTRARDILIVMLHPSRWPETPGTAQEINYRLGEISFGASLHTEIQGLQLAKRTAERSLFAFGKLERRLREINLHLIDAQPFTSQLSAISKLNTHQGFIQMLFNAGRERTTEWLANQGKALGKHSTFRITD